MFIFGEPDQSCWHSPRNPPSLPTSLPLVSSGRSMDRSIPLDLCDGHWPFPASPQSREPGCSMFFHLMIMRVDFRVRVETRSITVSEASLKIDDTCFEREMPKGQVDESNVFARDWLRIAKANQWWQTNTLRSWWWWWASREITTTMLLLPIHWTGRCRWWDEPGRGQSLFLDGSRLIEIAKIANRRKGESRHEHHHHYP